MYSGQGYNRSLRISYLAVSVYRPLADVADNVIRSDVLLVYDDILHVIEIIC